MKIADEAFGVCGGAVVRMALQLRGRISFILFSVTIAEHPVEKTITGPSPAGSEPHLPVQDTGQECVLFCQRHVSCCPVTSLRG